MAGSEGDSMTGCVFSSTTEASLSALLATLACAFVYCFASVVAGSRMILGLPRLRLTCSAGAALVCGAFWALWKSLMRGLTVERCLTGSQVLVSGGQFFHLTRQSVLPWPSGLESTMASTSQQESRSRRFMNQKSIMRRWLAYNIDMNSEEPTTSEEYIAQVLRQAREQEGEHVASHAELLRDLQREREDNRQKLVLCLALILLLTLSFLAIKLTAHEL